jgi:TRAP-type C4-dicarboxylate transport system permease small subunit
MLPDALPPRTARAVYVVADLIVLCFLGAVVGSSVALIASVREQGTITLGVSMLWFYAALPVCGALMFALTVRALVLRFRRDAA